MSLTELPANARADSGDVGLDLDWSPRLSRRFGFESGVGLPATSDGETDNTGQTAESGWWSTRPATQADSCHPEPLDDDVPDPYGLRDPIAESADVVDGDRYLADDSQPLSTFDAVRSYIRRRHGESTSADRHGFTGTRQNTALGQYKRGMALDRQCLSEWSNPTVVLLSLRISPAMVPPYAGRVDVLDELGNAKNRVLEKLRYELQNAPDAPVDPDGWQYFTVIAGTRERATPHLHLVVYINGDVGPDPFALAVDAFVETCDHTPDDYRGNPRYGDTFLMRGNGDESVPTVDGGPESQAATYALTQLPHLGDVDSMARDELMHSTTVDAWNGDAFTRSTVELGDVHLNPGDTSRATGQSVGPDDFQP